MRMARVAAVLSVQELEVWRGERCLFEGLDFDLDRGQTAVLVGPNGAGKTTLLRILAGLASPTGGRVLFAGLDVRSLAPEERGGILYRGHLDGLKKDFSVYENLEYQRRLFGGSTEIDPLLAELGLETKRNTRVRHLSAGQRRRASLASLRLAAARLWILDEPMTNLDAQGRAVVTEWVRAHVADGGLAVVATHQVGELARPGALMIEL
jgi:heme exporter protein A